MKKTLFAAQVVFAGLFCFTLLMAVFRLTGITNPFSKLDNPNPVSHRAEEFDPALQRLNNLIKLEHYCDSLYFTRYSSNDAAEFEENYTDLVLSVVRKRFYHGYSYYGFNDNYLAFLISKVSVPGYSAVVIPDDILKFPFAACSQQSIIMMELLKAKGLVTRKISFQGKKAGGHFCFEVYYNGSWHFFDPNMEPDLAVLDMHDRPGIAFLADHAAVLTSAYRQYPRDQVMDIFLNYSYGPINRFPAPNALLFHKITKVCSYTIWLFFLLAFVFVRHRYRRLTNLQHVRNSRIYLPQSESRPSSSYYPGLTAPGT